MSGTEFVFFDPFVLYSESREVFQGLSLYQVQSIVDNDKLPDAYTKKFPTGCFCAVIHGSDISQSLSIDLKDVLQESSSIDIKTTITNQIMQIFTTTFEIDSDMLSILTSTCYSYLIIGNKEPTDSSSMQGTFQVYSVLSYHHHPTLGTLIPYIRVKKEFRKQGLGTKMLILVQLFCFL